jgi:hypothetical protein
MRLFAAITFAALAVGSTAAGCPYAERAAAVSAQEKPAPSHRGPVEGKKGIFYSKHSFVTSMPGPKQTY